MAATTRLRAGRTAYNPGRTAQGNPKFDSRVDAYIEAAAPFAQPILSHLRQLVHQAAPQASETIKWGMPFYLQHNIIVAHMAAFKQHCAFGFWGPEMKAVLTADGLTARNAMGPFGRVTCVEELPPPSQLRSYITQAVGFVERGERTQSIDRSKAKAKPPLQLPTELEAALKRHKAAAKIFAQMTPSWRRDYAIWIGQAKLPATRERRVQQAIDWIAEGRSRGGRLQR
ncbi:MAG: YdeI/OmpD-associated family protein [Acidobacteriota bacterium]|nr:YdeI/OmpD-associated family protein [Acidobacteriota bacterium]